MMLDERGGRGVLQTAARPGPTGVAGVGAVALRRSGSAGQGVVIDTPSLKIIQRSAAQQAGHFTKIHAGQVGSGNGNADAASPDAAAADRGDGDADGSAEGGGRAGREALLREAGGGVPEQFVAMLLREPYKSSSFYVCELVRGATAYLESVGASLSIISTSPSSWPEGYGRQCAGVLVIPTLVGESDIETIQQMGCPFVTIAESTLPGPMIGLDMEAAARELTELLLDGGHRRFALVSGHEHHTDATKRRAILQTLSAAGIDADRVPDLQTNYDPAAAEDAAEALLRADPRPTAVIGFNDDLAVHVLTTAQQAGIAVPGQMSVAGFNDGPSAALLYPRLTTVRLPIAEAGEAAAQAVWQAHLTGEEPRSRSLPSTLVVRDSIGLAPSSK